MELSVCTDALYTGKKMPYAMEEIKIAGIDAVEFWQWQDKNMGEVGRILKNLSMHVAAICTSFFELTNPAHQERYIAGIRESIEVADFLGSRTLISQVGALLPNVPREEQQASIVQGLRSVAPLLERAEVVLVIEPLNLRDHPGYYLTSSAQAYQIIDQVKSPNVKVLFDYYHQQITEGDLLRNSIGFLDHIGHVHCAGNPGRNELNKGEINYESIFSALHDEMYPGYVGLEYFPTKSAGEGLHELVTRYGKYFSKATPPSAPVSNVGGFSRGYSV